MTGAASIGNIHINVPTQVESETPDHTSLLECPFCGRRNKPEGVFRCRSCRLDNLCLEHLDTAIHACKQCVKLQAKPKRKSLRKRKAYLARPRKQRSGDSDPLAAGEPSKRGLLARMRPLFRPMIALLSSFFVYWFVALATHILLGFQQMPGAFLAILCPILPAANFWLFVMRNRIRNRWPRTGDLTIVIARAWLWAELIFVLVLAAYRLVVDVCLGTPSEGYPLLGQAILLMDVILFVLVGTALTLRLTIRHRKQVPEET